jgi:protocatechuate 3,4-dioxygenase beta subunit
VFPQRAEREGWGQAAVEGQGDDEATSTVGQIFLPGVQLTDGNGLATFDTIYPGGYRGRTTQAKAAASQ